MLLITIDIRLVIDTDVSILRGEVKYGGFIIALYKIIDYNSILFGHWAKKRRRYAATFCVRVNAC